MVNLKAGAGKDKMSIWEYHVVLKIKEVLKN